MKVLSYDLLYCPGQVPVPTQVPTPPILTILWFFEILCVTAHHAKFLRSESIR